VFTARYALSPYIKQIRFTFKGLMLFNFISVNNCYIHTDRGARSGAVLQAGRSRVRFPMVSLGFFIGIILSVDPMALGSTQPLTEMSTRNISWGVKAAGAWG
jgi:hypothetical protein